MYYDAQQSWRYYLVNQCPLFKYAKIDTEANWAKKRQNEAIEEVYFGAITTMLVLYPGINPELL